MDAEEKLIGACLYPNDGYRYASKFVRPEDFTDMRLGGIFQIIGELDSRWCRGDPGTVAEMFGKYEIRNMDGARLWRMQAHAGTGAVAEFHAVNVHEKARRRRMHLIMSEADQKLNWENIPLDDTLSELTSSLRLLAEDTVTERINPKLLAAIMATADAHEDDDYDWVIPGLFERQDRMIVTGAEGYGKTTWLRQLAIMFAAGLHPNHGQKLPAIARALHRPGKQ